MNLCILYLLAFKVIVIVVYSGLCLVSSYTCDISQALFLPFVCWNSVPQQHLPLNLGKERRSCETYAVNIFPNERTSYRVSRSCIKKKRNVINGQKTEPNGTCEITDKPITDEEIGDAIERLRNQGEAYTCSHRRREKRSYHPFWCETMCLTDEQMYETVPHLRNHDFVYYRQRK